MAFHSAICEGLKETVNGRIVTFGINPTQPDAGYGYLELLAASSGDAVPLKRFVEKPVTEVAKAMLDAGTYLWNAGISLFHAKDMIAAFQAHAPELMDHVNEVIEQGHADLCFFRLSAEPWKKLTRCLQFPIRLGGMILADGMRFGWNKGLMLKAW